ncbi:MAG: YceI family protein [Bacteriovoracaceae bacterium]|nr:YceI family protein [Bacteriovoracaceae bacterium]
MKKSILVLLTAFVMTAQGASIDVSKSKVEWIGKKVTGEHKGEVSLKSGSLEMKEGKLVGGSVVMDMTTITTTDLTGEYATKLVTHLNSPDFFDVTNHKTATFTAKSVSEKGDKYTVKGDLTIKGKTQETTLDLSKNKAGFSGSLKFDRTKFDIKYGSGNFFKGLGDKMIYDDVELKLNLVTK